MDVRYRILTGLLAIALGACSSDGGTGNDGDETEQLDLALCSPDRGGFTAGSTNPFYPIVVGQRSVLDGEEDGESVQAIITVLDEAEVVAGVTTRVVEERESVDGELAEVSRNFFAQVSDGTVCYFGEDVDIFENGEVVSHEGAWRAGAAGARPGIIMPADPTPGQEFQMEAAPGAAEDEARIIDAGETVTVPAGTFSQTIRLRESNPLEGGEGGEKLFAAGVGVVVDEELELVSF